MRIPSDAKKLPHFSIPVLVAVLGILILGIASSVYVYQKVDESGRSSVLQRTQTFAAGVPALALERLRGTEEDLGTPEHETIKTYLTVMRSVNADARFLYIIGQKDEELFFYADSEPAESADYSPPGQIYYEATPAMFAVFEEGERQTEGPDQDRWGLWISGYAPITDEAGNVVALLGMDLPATEYLTDLAIYSALPLLVMLALVCILLILEQTRRKERAYVEQKTEFLSIASHEIRTPLTGIRWAVEGLLKRQNPPLDPKSRVILSLVHESCLGLVGRVNNLLDLSSLEGKTQVLRMEAISIRSFLEDIVDSLLLSARQRDVTLHIDVSVPEDLVVRGDRQILHHAFFNLLTNGIKYTHEGTRVSISYAAEQGMHAFSVSDEGDGIAQSEQATIFTGYHRTREAIRSGQYGTGLGLYLVKKATELHNGSVRVQSTPGNGATFTVRIPAST